MDEAEHVVVDERGFTAFYVSAHDEVYRALALTLRDADLAADATHEALARAWLRWEEIRSYANPRGWVYRVALNWARSGLRRRTREFLTGRAPQGTAVEMPAPTDPGVDQALRSLPMEQRAVVVLRLYCDWSVEEVAAALEIAPGTVKSRLSRALERLRARLEVEL